MIKENLIYALVVELVYTTDLKSVALISLRVRVPPGARNSGVDIEYKACYGGVVGKRIVVKKIESL